MGAGASAASMPIEQRRELYEDLRNKYTRDDLDALAEEEKQAWLEVLEDEREEKSAGSVVEEGVVAVETKAPDEEGGGGGGVEDGTTAAGSAAALLSSGGKDLSITAPEVSARQAAEAAAEAAAALTGASSGRKSGWDLSGEGNTGVRPQEKSTRLSFLLVSESDDDDGGGGGDAGCGGGGGGDGVSIAGDGAADEAGEGRRCRQEAARSKRASCEVPAWKKAAEELETPNELCVGDIVRARDKECNGMWFEGVLTAIHDEATFEVEFSTDEEEGAEGGSPQRITVGIEDVVRVMPWFCIEVGDMVECQPEENTSWIRGTVVNIALAQAMYDVALESGFDDESDMYQQNGEDVDKASGGDAKCDPDRDSTTGKEGEGGGVHHVHRVPDCRIRKIVSGRQAASRRWKKVYLATCLTSSLGRLMSGKGASSSAGD